MFLSLFGKNCIFAYLTLKFSFWPWRWPWVIEIIQEMDCPVKITWKWGITLAPGFICWKIIFDLEIFGGHFVFALKKFRPRVPKWHPADSCSGHPLEPESIIKHRPYRETRLSKKMPFDNWTITYMVRHNSYFADLLLCIYSELHKVSKTTSPSLEIFKVKSKICHWEIKRHWTYIWKVTSTVQNQAKCDQTC